jgi:RNA polymerase-binding transcription factor DksA
MEQYTLQKTALETLSTRTTEELQSIAVLNTEIGDWVIRTDNIDQNENDENIQADASEEADERIAILAELENRYRLIRHALKKLELGTYGMCEVSGEIIEEKRLNANPSARTCVHHMEEEFKLPLP